VYLFNLDEAEAAIGTGGGGHAIVEFQSIYVTYFPVEEMELYRAGPDAGAPVPFFLGVHELAHVLSHQALGKPGTRLLSEGLAVALDGGYGLVLRYVAGGRRIFDQKTLGSWMAQYRDSGRLLAPAELLEEQDRLEEALFYPQAGCFVLFVEEKFGLEALKTLFTAPDSDFRRVFRDLTGHGLEEIRDAYLEFVDALSPSRKDPPRGKSFLLFSGL
jgi:hypothetical protein